MQNTMWGGGGGGQQVKYMGFVGNNEDKGVGGRQKERRPPTPPRNLPPCGCKIDFPGRGGGGGEIIWFPCIIYTPVCVRVIV